MRPVRSKVAPIVSSSFFSLLSSFFCRPSSLLLACVLAFPAAAQTTGTRPAIPATDSSPAAGSSVDTVTVVGTPRSSTTPLAGPRIESPQWRASDPGAPDVDTTTYSALPASNQPAPIQPATRTTAGSGGRADGGRVPWWALLLIVGGVALAAQ